MKRIIVFILALFFVIGSLVSIEKMGIEEKIDEEIRMNVIILGKTQFLDTPDGFEKFCRENAGRKRSVLRKEVLAKLKEIANKEQPAVLEILENPKDAKPLWIVNSIIADLSPKEILKVSAHENVKYIYKGQMQTSRWKVNKTVSTVLEPEERGPFTSEAKKIPWNLEMIGASKTWEDLGVAGDGAVIAMLDQGANYNHEDLKKNIWINTKEIPNNGKDDDENGYVDDYYGYNFMLMTPEVKAVSNPFRPTQHGSVTSCIVAGDGTGGTVTGVAPRAELMQLMGGGYYAAFAYQYALENGADVINMSFSQPGLGNARGFWRMMCDHAVCAGLVSVSGAGNFQMAVPVPVQIRIPEGIPSVICAGGVDKEMEVPKYCSLGPVEWSSVKFYNDYSLEEGGLIKPDVCGFPGPGYPVIQFKENKGYIDPNDRIAGNSFSSPHISGVVALIFSANPELTAWRVKEILEETATDIGEPGKDPRTGAGLANAFKAVQKALAELK